MLIIGYPGLNLTVHEYSIRTNRTCRLQTAKEKGIEYLENLFYKNLSDLLKILQYNADHDIHFYRISSEIAPHCTNSDLIKDKNNYLSLVYDLNKFKKEFKRIGDYAKEKNIRLTFHPDPFNILNSFDKKITLNTYRHLHMFSLMFELMELDLNSCLVMHGGSIYNNKEKSMKKWIKNYNNLPARIRNRIVLENDERNYSIEDVLKISDICGVPIVFDCFHHYCFNKKKVNIKKFLPIVLKTWTDKKLKMKMHISEQACDERMGSHSDYVKNIPKELIDFIKKEKIDIYLMIEARMKELALFKLRDKLNSELNSELIE